MFPLLFAGFRAGWTLAVIGFVEFTIGLGHLSAILIIRRLPKLSGPEIEATQDNDDLDSGKPPLTRF
ncbi:MAG: hypothetical protein KDB01_03405 [Planctomycetaceae bacterium]|nr:hypothetical protein [Planctomycetaceae bacterium]